MGEAILIKPAIAVQLKNPLLVEEGVWGRQ